MAKKCAQCGEKATCERKNRKTGKWVPLCDSMQCYRQETTP